MSKPTLPDGWGDMLDALYAWAAAEAPGVTVLWEEQSGPAPTRPYVSLRATTPTGDGTFDERRMVPEGGAWDVAIASVEDEATYALEVDGFEVSVDSGVDATLETIREDLLDELADLDEVTAVATATGLRIRAVDSTEGTTVETADAKLEIEELLVEETVGNRSFTLNVQVLGGDLDAALDAIRETQAIAMALHDSLVRSDVHEALSAAGLALASREAVQTLPRIGAGWEGRQVFACRFNAGSVTRAVGLPWIETAAAVEA